MLKTYSCKDGALTYIPVILSLFKTNFIIPYWDFCLLLNWGLARYRIFKMGATDENVKITHTNVHVPVGAMEWGHMLHDCNGMCMIQLPEHKCFCNTDVVTTELESSNYPHSIWGKYPPSERWRLMVATSIANYTVCEDAIPKSIARWGERCGHPRLQSPRDKKVNILCEKKKMIFCAQQILNYWAEY